MLTISPHDREIEYIWYLPKKEFLFILYLNAKLFPGRSSYDLTCILLSSMQKSDEMLGKPRILSLFLYLFYKFNNKEALLNRKFHTSYFTPCEGLVPIVNTQEKSVAR